MPPLPDQETPPPNGYSQSWDWDCRPSRSQLRTHFIPLCCLLPETDLHGHRHPERLRQAGSPTAHTSLAEETEWLVAPAANQQHKGSLIWSCSCPLTVYMAVNAHWRQPYRCSGFCQDTGYFSPAPNVQTWFPSARILEQQTIVLVTHWASKNTCDGI